MELMGLCVTPSATCFRVQEKVLDLLSRKPSRKRQGELQIKAQSTPSHNKYNSCPFIRFEHRVNVFRIGACVSLQCNLELIIFL